ncbi:uncharacterized protein B4U80_14861 [Leptotrombidium deliense]|uniref:C2H2-type domain-containing protein n=1 Tax=Leptotrombidium deliense TaxID=299467 RepID=A0A443SFI6_9ACAR|nr:uncharacterized protein B4U80_14861 [Leptotrombidium deliense]
MASHRNKNSKELMINENKEKRYLSSVPPLATIERQNSNNGLKLKLKLKPNPKMVPETTSTKKLNKDVPFTETQNSQTNISSLENHSDLRSCCCFSSNCKSNNQQVDISLLREPLNLGKTNVKEILQCVHSGTVEVKDIIFNECDIIYECRVCRNLFRSLANFLSHKRFYCTQHCCEKMILFDSTTIEYEDEPVSNSPVIQTQNTQTRQSNENTSSQTSNSETNCVTQKRKRKSEYQFKLVRIPSNKNAMYQHLVEDNSVPETVSTNRTIDIVGDTTVNNCSIESPEEVTSSKEQSFEKQNILPKISLRIAAKSPLIKTPENLTATVECNMCNSSFSSKKTLRVHMKTIHAFRRMIYPCPFCCMTFKQISNGTRHMSQIHKKNKTQVKSLREVLRARAYPESNETHTTSSSASEYDSSDTEPDDSV